MAVRQTLGGQNITFMTFTHGPVVVPCFNGFRVANDAIVLQVGNPIFPNTQYGVESDFHRCVVVERRIGNLDDEQNVGTSGILVDIEIISGPKQDEVRLRGDQLVQNHCSLNSNDRTVTGEAYERAGRSVHRGSMARSDRTHFDDLAADEFDPFVRTKDAGIDHPQAFFDGKEPSDGL